MPSLDAAGSGIDSKHIVVVVVLNLEDVRVAADEDLRVEVFDEGPGAEVNHPSLTSPSGPSRKPGVPGEWKRAARNEWRVKPAMTGKV